MPFSVHLLRRFHVQSAVTYNVDLFRAQGTVWTFSFNRYFEKSTNDATFPPCSLLDREIRQQPGR